MCAHVPLTPHPHPVCSRFDPGNPGSGRGPPLPPRSCTHPPPARPGARGRDGQHVGPRLPHQLRLLGLPHVAHSAGRGRRGLSRVQGPPSSSSARVPGGPLTRRPAPSPRRLWWLLPFAPAAEQTNEGNGVSRAGRAGNNGSLCSSATLGGGVRGDVTAAGISKAGEMEHPTTACNPPARSSCLPAPGPGTGLGWGGGRSEALHRLLFEWVSSDSLFSGFQSLG